MWMPVSGVQADSCSWGFVLRFAGNLLQRFATLTRADRVCLIRLGCWPAERVCIWLSD